MQDVLIARRSTLWRPASRWSHAVVPEHYLNWLLDASSLTQRVIAVCTGGFRVRVLAQGWQRPFEHERRVLGARANTGAFVRQVHLLCGEQPWVYARTVIPRTTLVGPNRRLAHLGARPLGAALFTNPTMERHEVEIACLRSGDVLFASAMQGLAAEPDEVWGRRSVFRVHGLPLLVSEIFLPGIPRVPC